MSLQNNYASRPNSSIEVKSVELIPSIQGGLREQGANAYTQATSEPVEPRRIGKVRRPGDASGTVTGISTDSPNGEQWSAKIIPFCCIFNENNLVGVNNKQFPIAKIPIEVGKNTLGNYHHAKVIGYYMNTNTTSTSFPYTPKTAQLTASPFGIVTTYRNSYTIMFKAKFPITYDFANAGIEGEGFKPQPRVARSEAEITQAMGNLALITGGVASYISAYQNLPSPIQNQYTSPYVYDSTGIFPSTAAFEGKTGAGGNYGANWDDAQISDTDTAHFDLVLTLNFVPQILPSPLRDTFWGKIKGLVTLY